MKILIVEDDSVSALVLQLTLERLGHDVTVATDGMAAWEHLQQEYVPLVITDWMMPDMDGLELCRRVRALTGRSYTYLMLLTAKGQRADRLEGLGAGADDFLIKPLDADELMARLRTAERILNLQNDLEQQNKQLAEMMGYLKVANHRFAELFNGMPIPCFTYDAQGRIQEWNRAFQALYGLATERVLDQAIWQAIAPNEDEAEIREIVRRVFSGESLTGLTRSYRRPDGTTIEVEWTTFPAQTPEGEVVGSICAVVDVTQRNHYERDLEAQMRLLTAAQAELASANARLKAQVAIDGLTGLNNHRALHEQLEAAYAWAYEREEPLSLILMDLDKFKAYNDSFGHLEGDEALRRVAALLLNNVRADECVARYGGEEFAVLMPRTRKAEAVLTAERLRQAIEAADWPLRAMTASFGVTSQVPAEEDYRQMLLEADQALYTSKSQGRNCVTHFSELSALLAVAKAA